MIHPIRSIKERGKVFFLDHFKYTKHGRYMKKIHNTHLGQTCFVIGNGPSLTADDLTMLYKHNIDSFAVNRIFKIFPQTPWRPTYYVNTDHVMIRDIQDEINKLPIKDKFIPLQHKYYQNIEINNAHYIRCNFKRENDQADGGFSLDCTEQVNCRGTVTVECIQLAMHMGYRNIYLLGVDHNFDKVITESGEVVIDPGVKNYFIEGYDDDVANEVVHDLGTTTKAYMEIRRFCDSHGVNVYNATRTTKLRAFECVDFDLIVGEQESK